MSWPSLTGGLRHPQIDSLQFKKQQMKITHLHLTVVAVLILAAGSLQSLGSEQTSQPYDFKNLKDKGLTLSWIESLTQKEPPRVLRGQELKFIGMPVGGLCSGLVYVSGDGRLWAWDVFNITTVGVKRNSATYNGEKIGSTRGASYVAPLTPYSPLKQGFAIRWKAGGAEGIRSLDQSGGWKDISFTGSYPIGRVAFRDPEVPVQVDLEAFSPFIPLSTDDSSLPCTLMNYSVSNPSVQSVSVELGGWMENIIGARSANSSGLKRINRSSESSKSSHLLLTWAPTDNSTQQTDLAKDCPDVGSMAIGFLNQESTVLPELRSGIPEKKIFEAGATITGDRPVGGIRTRITLPPGGRVEITAIVAWHFPNLNLKGVEDVSGQWYSKKFLDASAVVDHVSESGVQLKEKTRLWAKTWNDSTLPCWLLNRLFSNSSILATTTCFRFKDGRFYSWEGVGAGAGTCTHVWSYAQAVGHLFPELERDLRQRTDFGSAFDEKSGRIGFRGKSKNWAVDGQAGCILRTYREHRMSSDDAFLRPLWPRVKKAMGCLMTLDRGDGLLDGAQFNTLDRAWHGKVAWLSGLYHAALRASEEMAREMGDQAFASECRTRFEKGTVSTARELFNGEYFISTPDPAYPKDINSGSGCLIDQCYGQSWAWQAGLGRVMAQNETVSALNALWKYNFLTDVGPYRTVNTYGRWYALPGDKGLLMCTFPRSDWNYQKACGGDPNGRIAGYFNECMSGFEWQVSAHMIAEGLVMEGLAIAKAIDERYDPSKRNPYNEIEFSDHYVRAMASYGAFISLCGFQYHGPAAQLEFAPKFKPEKFKAAFTTAEGWGSYSQSYTADRMNAGIDLLYGNLKLTQFAVQLPKGLTVKHYRVQCDGHDVDASLKLDGDRCIVELGKRIALVAGQSLTLDLR